jgi:hypothetical protein
MLGYRIQRRCRCGHALLVHRHYRIHASECSSCRCPRWRPRIRLVRRARSAAGQPPETVPEAEADAWLESLRNTGLDGTDDPPDPGMVARAHGWVFVSSACRDWSRDRPALTHVPGCNCLVAVSDAGEAYGDSGNGRGSVAADGD